MYAWCMNKFRVRFLWFLMVASLVTKLILNSSQSKHVLLAYIALRMLCFCCASFQTRQSGCCKIVNVSYHYLSTYLNVGLLTYIITQL